MFQFYALSVLSALIFQPITCVLGFILRWFWWPPTMIAPYGFDPDFGVPYKKDNLRNIAKERKKSLNRDKYGFDADSAKFLGMLSFVSEDSSDWKIVLSLIQSDGCIKRSLENEKHEENQVDFSGDMLSGFLLAVVDKLDKLTEDERNLLTTLWNTTTWEGWPLLFKHPINGKQIFKRGHIWTPWWVLGSDLVLTGLAWLYVGYKITGLARYKIAYYVFLALHLPTLLLATTCPQVFIGNFYAVAFHNIHSKALVFYSGYKVTKSWFFKNALNTAYKRHGFYNADVLLLTSSIVGSKNTAKDIDTAINLIGDAVNKGAQASPEDKKYLSFIWPPSFVQRSSKFLPPYLRGGDYLWERSPIKGGLNTKDYRKKHGLDVIFPTGLLDKLYPDE